MYPAWVTHETVPRLSPERYGPWQPDEAEVKAVFGDLASLLEVYDGEYDEVPSVWIMADLILQNEIQGVTMILCDFEPVGWGPGWIQYYFAEDPEAVRRQFADILDAVRAGFQRLEDLANREDEEEEEENPDEVPADSVETQPLTPSPTWRALSGGARSRIRRSRRGTVPPSIILVDCGSGIKHRVSFPRRGPIVLLDHPDREYVEAALAGPDSLEGCLEALRRVRARSSNRPWGWYMWLVHISPKFGQAGWTIRERLMEYDQRRKLRRLLRDVDLG
jgi:hypothetical protein